MASRGNRTEPKRPIPRLYLVTPAVAEPAAVQAMLGAAVRSGDVAAVLLRLAAADERTLINRATALAPLGWISLMGFVLIASLALGGVLLWTRLRASTVEYGATWGCGYLAPNARMQYTSSSFAGGASSRDWVRRSEATVAKRRGM